MRCISFLGLLPIALVLSTCGAENALAFPADNIPYCSDGFEKPARIVLGRASSMYLRQGDKAEIHFDPPYRVTLSVGDRTESFLFHEPGDDALSLYYSRESYEPEVSVIGNAPAYLAEVTIENTKVIVFADRVFWPCEK